MPLPYGDNDGSEPDWVYDPEYGPTNLPSLWSLDHQQNGPYDRCWVASRVVTYLGVLPVPVAGLPGTPPEYIQVHAPFQMRAVVWAVQRWGTRPQLPHWNTGNPNEVLVHSDISVGSPNPSQYSTAWQRVEGLYIYSIALPCEATIDGVPSATNLATLIPANVCNAEGYQFIHGIISPSNAAPVGIRPSYPG